MPKDELQLIQWLQSRTHRAARTLGIGDDMGMLDVDGRPILVASDMVLDGVHFDSAVHSLEQIGRKAVTCNLSDCAAMAVRPRAITLSVALPMSLSTDDAIRLLNSVATTAEEFGAELVGGDTNRWTGRLTLDVAILATPFPGIPPRTRAGARVGDRLFVTGPLGGSLRGKHMTFTPRVREARALADGLGASLHAMMDITDGLSLDLWRMVQASHVGAVLHADPLESAASDDARAAAAEDGRTVIDHVLADGEDFELLLAVEGEANDAPVPLIPVGEIVEGGLALSKRDGSLELLEPRGYVH